ncbi:hypothetical protein LELG_04678 [Lodderomyces elongisporus NRRL YB-4239]|uniref:Ubiquitin carboxyl-terminal hydrolase n=1 Tax=Lodderomyces elongisporus (strain ATCC 11503 / CBS 2605 / JCM 1781 / NBRC 1676 / NRRL YB-4239) TaxID=379508 RepID=A5E4Y9_LODEL|nr:hypothetical protein LELG_04678 [Lodderomyces elongisporus NRRL YB-4239]
MSAHRSSSTSTANTQASSSNSSSLRFRGDAVSFAPSFQPYQAQAQFASPLIPQGLPHYANTHGAPLQYPYQHPQQQTPRQHMAAAAAAVPPQSHYYVPYGTPSYPMMTPHMYHLYMQDMYLPHPSLQPYMIPPAFAPQSHMPQPMPPPMPHQQFSPVQHPQKPAKQNHNNNHNQNHNHNHNHNQNYNQNQNLHHHLQTRLHLHNQQHLNHQFANDNKNTPQRTSTDLPSVVNDNDKNGNSLPVPSPSPSRSSSPAQQQIQPQGSSKGSRKNSVPSTQVPESSKENVLNGSIEEKTSEEDEKGEKEKKEEKKKKDVNDIITTTAAAATKTSNSETLRVLPLYVNISRTEFSSIFPMTEQTRFIDNITRLNRLADGVNDTQKFILSTGFVNYVDANGTSKLITPNNGVGAGSQPNKKLSEQTKQNSQDATVNNNWASILQSTAQAVTQKKTIKKPLGSAVPASSSSSSTTTTTTPFSSSSSSSYSPSSSSSSSSSSTITPNSKQTVQTTSVLHSRVTSDVSNFSFVESELAQPLGVLLLKIMFDKKYSIFNNFPTFDVKPKGLTNTGNICFMNSILQILLYCQPFNRLLKLIETKSISELVNSSLPLLDATIKLFNDFKPVHSDSSNGSINNGKAAVPIEPFYHALSKHSKFSHLRWGQQEDAEEFLGYYLDALNEEFLTALRRLNTSQVDTLIQSYSQEDSHELTKFKYNVKTCIRRIKKENDGEDEDEWNQVGAKKNVTKVEVEPTPLNMIFGGEFKSIITIPKGSSFQKSITIDPFQQLQLDISQSDSIDDAFLHLNEVESISYMSNNNSELQVKKQTFVSKLPEVLIIHLKRFSYLKDQEVAIEKLKKLVAYNHKLSVPSQILSAEAQASVSTYQLSSVVYHHGANADTGHYTSDIYDYELKQWWRIDDTIVNSIKANEVLNSGNDENSKNAYILVYEKI